MATTPITWRDIIPEEHRLEFERLTRRHRRKQRQLLHPASGRLKYLRHRHSSQEAEHRRIHQDAQRFIAPWLQALRSMPCT